MTIKFERTSGIKIPKDLPECKEIKEFLFRRSIDYTGKQIIENKFYEEFEDYILVPRFFPLEKYFIDYEIVDKIGYGKDIEINSNIKLRDEIQVMVTNHMESHNNCIIQANAGAGKTVMSIYHISKLKKKTFVLVHRDSLVDQWRTRFLEYTDLKEEDVVRLTSSNFTSIDDAKIIITTNQTVASILSKRRDEFIEAMERAEIGVFLPDEVHTSVGAPTFSACSIYIPCKYTIGLSATPYRYDSNTDIIKFHLGEIFVPIGKDSTLPANITVLLTNSRVSEGKKKYLYFSGKFERARYLTLLYKSLVFLDVCNGLVAKFIKEERNIIVVGDRIKLLEELYNSANTTEKSLFVSSANNFCLKERVVFATTMKIRDGVDIPKKDCLIITSPVSNIEQLAGRVTRPMVGKPTPIIVDIVDVDCGEICRSIKYRIKFYKSKNWDIQYVVAMPGEKPMRILESDLSKYLK